MAAKNLPLPVTKEVLHLPCTSSLHPGQPDCLKNAITGGTISFLSSVKLYAVLYLVTGMMRRKGLYNFCWNYFSSVIRSSAFIGIFYGVWRLGSCWGSKVVGHSQGLYFIMAFLGSLLCIPIEHHARRRDLMLYTGNVAAESVYNMLLHRGYLIKVPHGTTLVFAASWAALCYLYKTDKKSLDSVQGVLQALFGNEQHPDAFDSRMRKLYQKAISGFSLPTPESPLVKTLMCSVRGVVLGFLFRGVLCLQSLLSSPKLFLNKNWWLSTFLLMGRFGLINGGLVGGTHGLSSLINYLRGNEAGSNVLLPAFLVGLIYKGFDNTDVAMWFGAKAVSGILSHFLAKVGFVAVPQWGLMLLYSLFTAIIFYNAAFEKHNLRTSYWKYLLNMNKDITSLAKASVHWRAALNIPGPAMKGMK